MQTTLIVNPQANKGRSQTLLPKITAALKQLGVSFTVAETQTRGHAVELAYQAASSGVERIVAVGGDGTCNEVVNGILSAAETGKNAIFGVIPTGSGNDFAYALNIPNNVDRACAILKNGAERLIDAGKVTVDGKPRFFDNSVGLGFDGEVVVDIQRSKYLRGFLMYLWSVFRVLGFGRWPFKMTITQGDAQIKQDITLITIANGPRAGGGFLLTPQAAPDDGLLDACYVPGLSKWGVLTLLPKTIDGSHIHHPAVTLTTASALKISVETGAPAHIDGEILCTQGREFQFEVLPKALRVWT